jgi:isopropylmalate/homocitrate/citramalate synthase
MSVFDRVDRTDAVDELTRQQVAALLAIGEDPEAVSKASGIPASEFASIAEGEKKRAAARVAAAKRGLDAKGIIQAAAAYQQAAASDPWATVPADVAAIVKRKVEIDPGLAGLDRRILVAFATQRKDAVAAGLFQVGVEDA